MILYVLEEKGLSYLYLY